LNLPKELQEVNIPKLVAATDGFTGADLKAMIEDGKAVYVYDKANSSKQQPVTDYFLQAISTVQENKKHYAAAEAQALLQPKSPFAGLMGSYVASRALRQNQDDD
jgi:hypothetical protein